MPCDPRASPDWLPPRLVAPKPRRAGATLRRAPAYSGPGAVGPESGVEAEIGGILLRGCGPLHGAGPCEGGWGSIGEAPPRPVPERVPFEGVKSSEVSGWGDAGGGPEVLGSSGPSPDRAHVIPSPMEAEEDEFDLYRY